MQETASATARILAVLRDGIVEGRYPAGTSLSEVALSEELGTSRTPVREALKQLEGEGLVRIVPRVGTFVAEPSHRDVLELFVLKEVLEGLAARLLAQRGAVAEVELLERNVMESEQAVRRGDAAALRGLVAEFHELVVRGADSRKLQLTYRWHMNQLGMPRLVARTLGQPGRPERSVAEHRLVLERILAKDPHGAELAMRDHVRASERALAGSLDG